MTEVDTHNVCALKCFVLLKFILVCICNTCIRIYVFIHAVFMNAHVYAKVNYIVRNRDAQDIATGQLLISQEW